MLGERFPREGRYVSMQVSERRQKRPRFSRLPINFDFGGGRNCGPLPHYREVLSIATKSFYTRKNIGDKVRSRLRDPFILLLAVIRIGIIEGIRLRNYSPCLVLRIPCMSLQPRHAPQTH